MAVENEWDGTYSGACAVWTDRSCRELDLEAFRQCVRNVLGAGSVGIGLASLTMHNHCSLDEQVKLIRIAADEVRGKVHIVASSMCYSTWEHIEWAKRSIDAGADCILLPPPIYIMGYDPLKRDDPELIVKHYTRFDREGIKFLVHGGPAPEGTSKMFPPTVKKVASECENLVGWKIADRGNLTLFRLYVDILREAEKKRGKHITALLAGEGTLVESYLNGADGNTSGAGIWRAKEDNEIRNAVKRGDITGAFAIQNRLRPVVDAMRSMDGGSGMHFSYKLIAWLLGKIPTAYERLPERGFSKETVERVRQALIKAGMEVVREAEEIPQSDDM